MYIKFSDLGCTKFVFKEIFEGKREIVVNRLEKFHEFSNVCFLKDIICHKFLALSSSIINFYYF